MKTPEQYQEAAEILQEYWDEHSDLSPKDWLKKKSNPIKSLKQQVIEFFDEVTPATYRPTALTTIFENHFRPMISKAKAFDAMIKLATSQPEAKMTGKTIGYILRKSEQNL